MRRSVLYSCLGFAVFLAGLTWLTAQTPLPSLSSGVVGTIPSIGGPLTGATAGSILFGASGTFAQLNGDRSGGGLCFSATSAACSGNTFVVASASGTTAQAVIYAPGAQQAAFNLFSNGAGRLVFGAQGNGDLFFYDANHTRDFMDISNNAAGDMNLMTAGGDVHVGGNSASGFRMDVQSCGANGCARTPTLVGSGTQPGITGCSASIAGGSTPLAGAIISGTAGDCKVELTFAYTAPNGWVCSANDEYAANLIRQTGFSSTGVTFSGTTGNGDFITYQCVGF